MRKRSKYRPKGVRLDAMAYVASGLRPLAGLSAGTDLRIKNHQALTAVRESAGGQADVDKLIEALNITEALSRMQIGQDYAGEIRAGQDALLTLARRGLASSGQVAAPYAATPEELDAIVLAMDVHDAQLDTITVNQLEQAFALVHRVVRGGTARPIKTKQGDL